MGQIIIRKQDLALIYQCPKLPLFKGTTHQKTLYLCHSKITPMWQIQFLIQNFHVKIRWIKIIKNFLSTQRFLDHSAQPPLFPTGHQKLHCHTVYLYRPAEPVATRLSSWHPPSSRNTDISSHLELKKIFIYVDLLKDWIWSSW